MNAANPTCSRGGVRPCLPWLFSHPDLSPPQLPLRRQRAGKARSRKASATDFQFCLCQPGPNPSPIVAPLRRIGPESNREHSVSAESLGRRYFGIVFWVWRRQLSRLFPMGNLTLPLRRIWMFPIGIKVANDRFVTAFRPSAARKIIGKEANL